ncbi:MAG: TatD family hydrolase [Bacteroidales bacterium]
MKFIDTHTHLYLEQFDHDRREMVNTALNNGVGRMLMPNVDGQTIGPLMKAAQDFPGVCLPMMALHPTSVKADWETEMEQVDGLLRRESFVAVGETGLDLYWDKTFFHQQVLCFRRHIELALELDLPLVIHSRNSLEEIFGVLGEYKGSNLKGVMHCFAGDIAQAERAIAMNFLLGIGGVVTFKNSLMAQVVQHVDLQFLVLETDAPYLAPVPHRGKRNESAYLPLVAQKVAQLKEVPVHTVAEATTASAGRLFGLS